MIDDRSSGICPSAEDLIVKWRNALYRRYLHAYDFDSDTAEDLVQLTCIRVVKGWDKAIFLTEKEQTSWIFTIAHNVAMTEISRRRNHLRLDEVAGMLEQKPPPDQDRLIDIGTAINNLPPDKKRVLKLWHQGHSVKEIAEMMGKSARRIRRDIREALEQIEKDCSI